MYNLLLTILFSIICCDCDCDFHATNQKPIQQMYLMPAQVICLNAVKHAVLKL